MTAQRFDQISRLFAARRLSRRQALATGSAGIAVGAFAVSGLASTSTAQDATPEPGTSPSDKTAYLFVQSFQSGRIVPTDGVAGRYTVTLDHGLGETVYFGDRPSRDVGTTPTPQFLEGLGFLDDNPPNAALLVETAPGETDIAVIELFNPAYDPTGPTVTYEVQALATWADDLDLGLRDAPADLAALAPGFGTAHLLIDDCPDGEAYCNTADGAVVDTYDNVPSCWNYGVCIPCEPYGHDQPSICATGDYWSDKCNQDFPAECGGTCQATFSWTESGCA